MGVRSAGLLVMTLGGCGAQPGFPVTDNPEPMFFTELIETDEDGRCFARASGQVTLADLREMGPVSPANEVVLTPVTEAVEEDQIILSPEAPVLFLIDEAGRFETVCPEELTQDFVSSLQRAMAARNAYSGPITGMYDAPTAAAVLLMQRETLDLNSEILARESAETLGLSVVELEPAETLF